METGKGQIRPIQFITQLRFLGVILINLRLSFTGYNRPKPPWTLAICHGHPISFFPPTDAIGDCCPALLFAVGQASQRLYLLQTSFMFRRIMRQVCWFLPHLWYKWEWHQSTSVIWMSIPGAPGQESLMHSGSGQKTLTQVHQAHANIELQEQVKDIFLGSQLHLLNWREKVVLI